MVKHTLPPEERVKFFVYIIESPSPPDLYHKRYEGDMLIQALSLDSIHCSHRIAINEESFRAAILVGLDEEMKQYKDLIPIIHISAHGSSEGIGLSDGKVIEWKILKELLSPINKALNNNLLLCMSSCEGYSACRMAMSEDETSPFFAVVGNSGKPTWSDTAIAYAAFYHLIAKGCFFVDAVKAMQEATNDEGFMTITGTEARRVYLDVIKKQEIGIVRNKLEEEISKNPPSQEATDLEKSK